MLYESLWNGAHNIKDSEKPSMHVEDPEGLQGVTRLSWRIAERRNEP